MGLIWKEEAKVTQALSYMQTHAPADRQAHTHNHGHWKTHEQSARTPPLGQAHVYSHSRVHVHAKCSPPTHKKLRHCFRWNGVSLLQHSALCAKQLVKQYGAKSQEQAHEETGLWKPRTSQLMWHKMERRAPKAGGSDNRLWCSSDPSDLSRCFQGHHITNLLSDNIAAVPHIQRSFLLKGSYSLWDKHLGDYRGWTAPSSVFIRDF